MTTSKEKGRACWPVRLDVLFAALLVSPVYLAASVGRLAGFVDRHLWMVGVVTVAQVLWTALESFQGSSLGERWRSGLLNGGLSVIPAALFWLHKVR
jgi:hypothetical protein